MPALRYRGKPLLSVMATKSHLSLFPFSASVVAEVAPELEGYDVSKGTIRFSADRLVPAAVVTRIVELRRAEDRGLREASGRRSRDPEAGKVGDLGEVSEWPKERDWKSRTW